MATTLEIRWHARAGQGAVTAAKTVAEAAMEEGKYIQASPEYGPERSGAPMRAFNRISDAPLRVHSQVTTPDIVVVIDPTLLDSEDILEGTREGAAIIVNAPEPPGALRTRLGIAGRRVYTLDATRIALDEIGRNYPNTPMLGALARVAGQFGLEAAKRRVAKSLGDKVKEAVLQGNLRAVQRGFDEVQGEPDGSR